MNMFTKLFHQKSATTDQQMSSLDVDFTARADLDNSPKGLVRLAGQCSWVSACVRRLAWSCGDIQPRVYAEGLVGKMITPHKAASKMVVKEFTRTNKAVELVELTSHPLVDMLSSPTKNVSWPELVGLSIGYMSVTGNAFSEILRSSAGKPIGLTPLMSECVELVLNQDGTIKEYRYVPPNGAMRMIPAKNMFAAKLTFVGSTGVGHGMLECCLKEATLLNSITDQTIAQVNNGCTPSLAVAVKGKIPGTQKEAEAMAEAFMRKFGQRRQGRPMVSFGEVDVKPVGNSPRDMEYDEARAYLKSSVAAAFGVPYDLIATDSSNRATATVALESFSRNTIMPLIGSFYEQFNQQVASEYGSKVWIWYDPKEVLAVDPVEQATVLNSYIGSGVMTVPEVRAILGLDVVS